MMYLSRRHQRQLTLMQLHSYHTSFQCIDASLVTWWWRAVSLGRNP